MIYEDIITNYIAVSIGILTRTGVYNSTLYLIRLQSIRFKNWYFVRKKDTYNTIRQFKKY